MSEKREPLRLAGWRSWGEATCGFGLTDHDCDKPATRHFLWLDSNATSAACDEHAAYIHNRDTSAMPFDEHAHSGDCGMPGSHWRFPYEDEDEGYCFFPSPDDASLLAEEPVSVGTIPVAKAALAEMRAVVRGITPTESTEYEEQS